MPDPLKLAALAEAGYAVLPTCGSCAYFEWYPPTGGRVSPQRATPAWGSCRRLTPVHAKHTDGARISTRSDGTCPAHAITAQAAADLERSGFDRFRRGP